MSKRAPPKSRNAPPTRQYTLARQGAYRAARVAGARAAPPPRRRVMRDELKYYDTALATTTVAAATDCTGSEYDPSATSMISTPVQGDGPTNRDGKQILIKNVGLKGTVYRPATEDAVNPPAAETVSVFLVLDTQSNAAQAQGEQVFVNPAATAASNPVPLRNLLNGSRFKVLKHEVFCMDVPSVSVEGDNLHSAPGVMKTFDWYIPTPDLLVHFNAGTTADIANVVDNSLHVMAFSTAAACTLSYNARIRFEG